MTGHRWLAAAAVAVLGAAGGGCVQRTITVESDPAGALVWLNDEEVGRTPVTVPFTFYGTYDVRLRKEGYQTLQTATKARPPWWDLPGPDLAAEVLPGRRRVELVWEYELQPLSEVDEEELLERARELRRTFDEEAPP